MSDLYEVPDAVIYIVHCGLCDNSLTFRTEHPWIGTDWCIDEETRQMAEAGWSYTRADIAVCPTCAEEFAAEGGLR